MAVDVKHLSGIEEAVEAGVRRGRLEERAAVVAYLRAHHHQQDVGPLVSVIESGGHVASGIEGGYTVDANPEARARVRERFGLSGWLPAIHAGTSSRDLDAQGRCAYDDCNHPAHRV